MQLLLIIILAILLAPIVGILVGGFFGATVGFFAVIFRCVVVFLIIGFIFVLGDLIIKLTANYYQYILPALITLIASVLYFKKKEIKKIYTTIESNFKNKVSKITENFILRTIIIILIVIILYLIIK
jgi:hypothetical protein